MNWIKIAEILFNSDIINGAGKTEIYYKLSIVEEYARVYYALVAFQSQGGDVEALWRGWGKRFEKTEPDFWKTFISFAAQYKPDELDTKSENEEKLNNLKIDAMKCYLKVLKVDATDPLDLYEIDPSDRLASAGYDSRDRAGLAFECNYFDYLKLVAPEANV